MTTSTAMDINTFCPLPIWIPTFQDCSQQAWFILNDCLLEALDLPEDFALHERLEEADLDSKLPAYAKDENDAWKLVSESGLYQLILLSQAPMFQAFRTWATQIVLPTAAEDGLFIMGEEQCFLPPLPASHMNELESQEIAWLAGEVLPEIRKDGAYAHNELLQVFVKKIERGDPVKATVNLLKTLKGHRYRKSHRLH